MGVSDDSSANSSLEIYKYRRRDDKNEHIFMFPPDDSRIPVAGQGHDEKTVKTYAVLQEKRGENKYQRLRSLFLLYSTNSWKVFIIGTLFFAYILDMWLYAFCDIDNRPFGCVLIAVVLDCVYTADVIFVVSLKLSRKWRKTLNLVEADTCKVVLDCLIAIPYSILYFIRIESFDLYAIVPVASMMREYRIIEYFYNKSSQAGSNQWNQFLLQYLMIFLHLVHTFSCIWYLFAYQGFEVEMMRTSWSMSSCHLPTETKSDWYFVSVYWSIMFLTTNCLGDLYPLKTTERVCSSLAIIFGFLLTSIVFVGSLNSQFITITTRRSKYVSQLKKIKNHLKLINMDADDARRIIRYYEDLWYQKSGVFKPAFLELLPSPLQMEICYDLNAVPLYSSLIFRKLPEPFIRRLSLSMTHQFYLPGDIVYNHNNNKTIMVCITKGVLELLSDEDDESPMISFTKGTCFGEISLVYNVPARCTVKAATYVECQVLQKKEFMKLMITYPDIVDIVRSEVQERINRSLQRKNVQEKNAQVTLNIYASKFKKKSSIKCLKDKLRYIQGKTDEDLLNRDDQLDEYSLDLYLISEHTKKTDMNFICLNTNFPWILDSDCNLVKIWTAYMLLIVFYICLLYPYFLGYLREFPADVFFYVDIIISISLVVNVIMNCCTAVKTKKKQIKKFKSIVSYRMNTLGFYLDLVAIIPFEYLVTAENHTYTDLYREHLFYLCKGIKLCLVWRLSSFFENLEKKLLLNTILIKICKYIVYIFLLCYWSGVVLYMESCFISRCYDNSWFSMALMSDAYGSGQRRARNPKTKYPYLTAMYLATTLLLSIGYGDFVPGDQFDMALIAFLSIYGVILIGYCVAEFSSLITHWSRTKTAFLEVVITIDKFMKDNNFNSTIKSRIMAFYELQWQYNSGVEITGESWLHKTVVPIELQKKVLHQARFKALTSIKFFQVKNKAFIHTITEKAREIILPPGEIVYNGGTVTRELYIIESGYCVVAAKTAPQQKIGKHDKVIGPGNHLGLLVLLYGVPSLNTVYTLTHCKLLCIDHWAYTSALSLFPDMKEHDGLVTQAELDSITKIAEAENAQRNFQPVMEAKTKKERIAHTLQELFDGSFISLLDYYSKQNKSYLKSYKPFNSLRNIAPYVLLPYAIKPDGLFIICWTFLRTVTAFLICLLVPIIVAMAPLCTIFNRVIVILEVICYIDMYVRLHLAYYGPKNQLIYHPYLTAKNYLTGPFILDIITCFPWYIFMVFLAPKHTEGHSVRDHMVNPHFYHCVFRLINVCQIYKLHIAFWTETVSALKRAYLMSVVQFLILTLFFLNFYTAILITVSCRYVTASDVADFRAKVQRLSLKGPYMHTVFYPGGNMVCQKGSWIDTPLITSNEVLSPARVYLFALYWTTGSFNGAAFGDFTAQDTASLVLSIIVTLQGSFFFGYVYATIASLKAVADQVTTRFQENLKHLDMFLTREKVSITLKKSVLDYFKYQWKRTAGWSHQSILGKLHANLNEDAVLFMYEKTLRDIPLFEGVEYSFFRAFAKNLKERYFQKGHLVMRESEVISNMFIIYRGKVDIITKDNELETCMGPGGIFGNIRGAAKYFTLSNVIASRNIDLLCIDGSEFYALLKSYPAVLKKVQESIDAAVKDYVIPVITADRSSGDNYDFDRVPDSREIDEEEDDDTEYHIYDGDISTGSADKSYGSRYSHSVSSIGNTVFMTAGKLFMRPDRWFRSSIIPDGTWVVFFEYLALCLSYIDFFLLTYQMAYMSVPHFVYICIVIDLLFLYKIFLDMHSGYMNRYGDYVLEPRKVRAMYFSKTYLRRRDFLVNIHLSYFIFAFPFPENNLHSFFAYLRTPQLFRITYLLTYKSHRKLNIGTANLFFKLAFMGVWASVITHINACIFFRLSCMTKEHCKSINWMANKTLNLKVDLAEENYFSLYIAALWYTLNVLTICGTGDITSQNDIELVETIILTILIKFSTGLLISEVSAMITAHNSSLIEYDYGINELRDGLRDMGLSQHQMTKMWDYVRELWNRQQGQQMPELIQELPQRLQSQIMDAVYGYHINISLIFNKTDEHFKRMLCTWLRHCVFFPGNYIVQCGDADQCIYFIHRGEVEVLTVHQNLTESIYDILGPEDCFGIAQGLYVGVPHHFSFRARTVVDIVYLQLDQWKYLLDFYPKAAKMVTRKVENIYVAS